MSDISDPGTEVKEKENSTDAPSSSTNVSNGLNNTTPETTSSNKEPETKEEETGPSINSEESSSNQTNTDTHSEIIPSPITKRKKSLSKGPSSPESMTNKDVPVKPAHRTRLRSRSKSSNSEDLKQETSSNKAEAPIEKEICTSEAVSEDATEAATPVEDGQDDVKLDSTTDHEDKPEEKEEEQEQEVEPDLNMEVDEEEQLNDSTEKLAEPKESEPSSPKPALDDDSSSDFLGFDDTPVDRYTSFSAVLRPYEGTTTPDKGSPNGPMNYLPKHLSQSPRIAPVRSSPSNRIDVANPEFRKPFDFGWRRELVFRSTNENSVKRNADVYYYTPTNKKVRSLREVMEHLIPGEGLSSDNFTFCKESLGIDDPDKEIIREAKWKPSQPSDDGYYSVPLKKPTPKIIKTKRKEKKEKVVKEFIELSPSSSPSTSSTHSPVTPRIVMKTSSGFKVNAKRLPHKGEKKRKTAGHNDTTLDPLDDWCPEPKTQIREVCSIECRLAMGLIPTLQCVKCLCLYHPECVNLLEAKERQIHSYVCKYCQKDAKKDTKQTTKLPPPPPLTPIVAPPTPKKDKEIVKVVANTPAATSVAATTTRSQTIVGSVTTWLPASSSIQVSGSGNKGQTVIAPRTELESSPQSLISVQGKKYVVIPKVNRVKLDGRGDGGGEEQQVVVSSGGQGQSSGNSGSVYLVPYNPPASSTYVFQTPNTSTPTYIVTSGSTLSNGLKRSGSDTGSGSDGSPPAKMSAVSPKSAPSVKAVGLPKQAPKVSPAPKQSSAKSPAQPTTTTGNTTISQTTDFMNLFNAGYVGLLHAFQYLKVHELLRAACVCKMWRHMASHRTLWETVKMKNSRVRNWDGFGRSLRTNGTKCLDLKKMLVPEGSEAVTEMWKNMANALKSVPTLTKIDLGRCTPENLELIVKACPQLESITTALSIRGPNPSITFDLSVFKGEKLVELKLKSVGGMDLTHYSALKKLVNLKHLSLTTVKVLSELDNLLPVSLETLELGECCQISESFAVNTLPKLKNLVRLRLEKGQGASCPTTQLINSISGLEKLAQLELINFDIKPGFDKALAKCCHVKTLLIIPTYVTQSATTNHVVMGGVTKLSATLKYFIWGLTLELLRVTDLFIDQVEGQKQKAQPKKGAGDSIPILKPLSDESAEPSREGQTTSQVDILALPKLQRVLSTLLPNTRVKILKVPFSATWRQTVD